MRVDRGGGWACAAVIASGLASGSSSRSGCITGRLVGPAGLLSEKGAGRQGGPTGYEFIWLRLRAANYGWQDCDGDKTYDYTQRDAHWLPLCFIWSIDECRVPTVSHPSALGVRSVENSWHAENLPM